MIESVYIEIPHLTVYIEQTRRSLRGLWEAFNQEMGQPDPHQRHVILMSDYNTKHIDPLKADKQNMPIQLYMYSPHQSPIFSLQHGRSHTRLKIFHNPPHAFAQGFPKIKSNVHIVWLCFFVDKTAGKKVKCVYNRNYHLLAGHNIPMAIRPQHICDFPVKEIYGSEKVILLSASLPQNFQVILRCLQKGVVMTNIATASFYYLLNTLKVSEKFSLC